MKKLDLLLKGFSVISLTLGQSLAIYAMLVAMIVVFGNGLSDQTAELLTYIAAVPPMLMGIILPRKICKQVVPELYSDAHDDDDNGWF